MTVIGEDAARSMIDCAWSSVTLVALPTAEVPRVRALTEIPVDPRTRAASAGGFIPSDSR